MKLIIRNIKNIMYQKKQGKSFLFIKIRSWNINFIRISFRKLIIKIMIILFGKLDNFN